MINRDRFYVFHQQDLTGDEGSATYKSVLFGLPNTVVVGFDYSHLNFNRIRGFPNNDLVDPFNPSPGLFGPLLQPGDLVPRASPTHWNDYAAFFEDVIDLGAPVKLVTGGRYDRLDLDRQNFNTLGQEMTNGFTQDYTSANWRVGLVYDVNKYVTPYLSWTTGKDPPGTNNIFLVNAPEGQFALSSSRQVEVGIKARTPRWHGGRDRLGYMTSRNRTCWCRPAKKLQATASQTSKGVELTGSLKLTRTWTVEVLMPRTPIRSLYLFSDPLTGSTFSYVQPANIPRWTANAWTSVRNIASLLLEARWRCTPASAIDPGIRPRLC